MSQTLSGDVPLDLPEMDDPPADPVALLARWVARAEELGVREPGAATLSTTGADGPSARTVLVRRVEATGPVFATSALSRKGRELAEDPRCALTFYWRETLQQVRVAGRVERAGAAESDAEFDARHPMARATVLVSRQSEPLEDEDALHAAARQVADSGGLRRPEHWHLWRVVPTEIELWHGSLTRLHRRLEYRREGAGQAWSARRLQP